MQPLYSVDHETRQNTCHPEDEVEQRTEETPLLHRFPEVAVPPRNMTTTVIVSFLLSLLISGVIIGIYLLVLQYNSENVLPPVEMAVQFVSRSQWDTTEQHQLLTSNNSHFKTGVVIIVQTDSKQCESTKTCVELLKELQANTTDNILSYNFLISSNGQTYEVLGWHKPSLLFLEYSNVLVLGFIGNFSEIPPTVSQMQEAENFFAESISHQYLDPNFTLIGKYTKSKPKYLFRWLKRLPQWNHDLSDNKK